MYAPEHYQNCTVEYKIELQPIDAIRNLPFPLGCAIKYLCRAGHKEGKAVDLRKASDYLEDCKKHLFVDDEEYYAHQDTLSMIALTAFAKANKYVALLLGDYGKIDELNAKIICFSEEALDNTIKQLSVDLQDLRDE